MERAPRMGGKRPRKKVCMFCVDRVDVIDYKDIAKLRKCMTERQRFCREELLALVHIISGS